MPDVLKSSLHGIVMPPGLNFDGSDATKYPLLLWNIRSDCARMQIPRPKSTDTVFTYLVKNQRLNAVKDAEKQLLTNPFNATTISGGYISGDNALRAYVAAQKMNDNEKFLVCAIIMREVKKGSQAEVILTRVFEAKNFVSLLATLKTHYRSRTFPVLLSLIKIGRSPKTTFDFINVLDMNVRGMSCLIARHFYDNRGDVIDIGIRAIHTALKQTMSANITPKVEPEAAIAATIDINLYGIEVNHQQLRSRLKNKLNPWTPSAKVSQTRQGETLKKSSSYQALPPLVWNQPNVFSTHKNLYTF